MIKKKRPRCRLRTAKAGQKSFVKRLLFYVAFFLFSGLVIWIFLFSNLLEVKKISLSEKTGEEEEIRQYVEDELKGFHLSLIPKSNLILIKGGRLEEGLKDHFKVIKKIEVRKIFPDELKLQIGFYSGQFIFCSGENCYLVDDAGEAYYKLGPEGIKNWDGRIAKVVLRSEQEIRQGESIIPEVAQFCSELGILAKEKADLEIENTFITNSLATGELEIKTKEGWLIFISTVDDPGEQLAILKRVLVDEVAERRSDLEYVDLRLKGKVFYKFKQDKEEESGNQEDE